MDMRKLNVWTKWQPLLVRLPATADYPFGRGFKIGHATVAGVSAAPGQYELQLRSPTGRRRILVYHGIAENLRSRVLQHARRVGHIRGLITWHVGWQWCLYVRWKRTGGKRQAMANERFRVKAKTPPWNVQHSMNRAGRKKIVTAFFPDFPTERPLTAKRLRESKARLAKWLKEDRKMGRVELRFMQGKQRA
ncbi:MAG: hypothetical protein KF754_00570 [Planctomycetes bacterium]|nr:hypothetical protein [Planctomycetota bacterium]